MSSTAGAVRPAAGVNAEEGKSQQVPGGLESGIGLGSRDSEGVGRRLGKGIPNSLLRDSKIREGDVCESEEATSQEKLSWETRG